MLSNNAYKEAPDMKRSLRVQLVVVHPDGKQTIINTTNDPVFLDKIVEDRDGTVWIGSDLCDLRVQVVT